MRNVCDLIIRYLLSARNPKLKGSNLHAAKQAPLLKLVPQAVTETFRLTV